MISTLEELALRVLRSRGQERNIAFAMLKGYVRDGPEVKIAMQIGQLENREVVRHLVGCGLTTMQQNSLLKRAQEMKWHITSSE